MNMKLQRERGDQGRCVCVCVIQCTWGDGGAVLVGVAPTYGPDSVRVGVGVCVQAGGADDRGALAQRGDGGGGRGGRVGKTLRVGVAVSL